LGRHLAPPPTLDTQTLPQELDENQEFVFNFGEGNVQPGVSLSEEERIRRLKKEIEELQNLLTTMLNELEVRARKWAELEAKMEEEREKSKASERIEKKPRESGKSKASGRIEKKPKKKPTKTQNKLVYVDLSQTQEDFCYIDCT